MVKKFSAPRGTSDIYPQQASVWQELETQARQTLACYGYGEIRTPLFEDTELFVRSVGQTSDIVQKQMLNIAPQGTLDARDIEGYKLSLRPEGTAAVVRAYIQAGMDKKEFLSKLFYIGAMFRGERPQKGRLRQFHQIGVEAIGPDSCSPYLDSEVIGLCLELLKNIRVPTYQLKINSLGTQKDKQAFSEELRRKLQPAKSELCSDCHSRFDRNVFRILDCKKKTCRQIVGQLKLDHAYLCKESRQYYQKVKQGLQALNIPYEEDPAMVRGLDYYTHTVFEVCSPSLGSQDALGAGGRYDNLVSQLGGPKADAVGFAVGLERILLARGEQDINTDSALDVFLISLDGASLANNFKLANSLRKQRLIVDMSFKLASLKSQMRTANKKKARFVVIRGEEEQRQGMITLKDMQDGRQEPVAVNNVEQKIMNIIKR